MVHLCRQFITPPEGVLAQQVLEKVAGLERAFLALPVSFKEGFAARVAAAVAMQEKARSEELTHANAVFEFHIAR
eukprot:2730879-Lingulodinium_polyedra.AAC.1